MKKVNVGIILTILVIIVVVIYNIDLESKRSKDREQISDICKEYIDFATKYTMLEEKYRTLPKTITEEEYANYLLTIKGKIASFFVDNNEYIENQYNMMKEYLDKQVKNDNLTVTYMTKDIISYNDYSFINNTAEVVITTYLDAKYLFRDENDNKVYEKTETNKLDDTIVLEKVDGEWKVKHADLKYIDVLTRKVIKMEGFTF